MHLSQVRPARRRSKSLLALSIATGIAGAGLVAAAPAGAGGYGSASAPVVVLSGLNNPRQLSLVDGHELLVAEAGKGGATKIGEGDEANYVGATGSIAAVWGPQSGSHRTVRRIVTGLISAAGSPDGSFAVGSDGVSAAHGGSHIYIQETYAPPDVVPAPLPYKQLGKLLSAYPYTRPQVVADISSFERAHDPDRHGFDSNPYAVLALPNGEQLVADAAGNDVLRVSRHGRLSVFHVFSNVTSGDCASQNDPSPQFPGCNYVPTSLATDRWGNVYVGGLVSEVPGQGRVTMLDRWGHVKKVWSGFTSVTGVAVGRDGSLYVSQLEAPEQNPPADMVVGVLTKVDCRGHRTDVDVPFPAGVAVDARGTVFVSAWSGSPSTGLGVPGADTSGQVWRLRFGR